MGKKRNLSARLACGLKVGAKHLESLHHIGFIVPNCSHQGSLRSWRNPGVDGGQGRTETQYKIAIPSLKNFPKSIA